MRPATISSIHGSPIRALDRAVTLAESATYGKALHQKARQAVPLGLEDDQPLARVDTHAQSHLSNNNGRCFAVTWLFRGIPRFLILVINRQDAGFQGAMYLVQQGMQQQAGIHGDDVVERSSLVRLPFPLSP